MKRISLLLVFVMLFATLFALSVFADEATCEHDYYFTSYSPEDMPACGVKGGTEIYTCILCGETKEVYQETAHNLSCKMYNIEGKEPTCTEAGYAWYECMGCIEGIERKVAPQHQYEQTAYIPSTCTEDGSQTWTCALCGDSYEEPIISYGHNQKWEYDSTTATCTQAGVEIFGCWNCEEKIEVPVDAYGHEWSVDDSTLDLDNHTVNKVCSTCGETETISSLGMEADPIATTVSGSFTASVTNAWTYYTFTHTEGYITFTFDTDDVNVMIKDTTGTYATQYFWGGETTWTGELMADGSYLIAICSNSGAAFDIAVTTEFEEADVPNMGEIASKPIIIEGTNTAYTSTGNVWYTFETPTPGAVTITIEGNATVSYGVDPEALTVYTAPFVDEYGWTKYYILVKSEEEATIVVNVEAPKGSMDNPLEIVVGENNTVEYAGGWQTYYAVYEATSAGTLTITFDSENAVIYCGTHPYMIYTYVVSGDTIEVSPWTTYYFGISTYDEMPATFDITASFEAASIEPEEPDGEIGEVIDSMEVETTDTYGYFDEYTYTAENAGKYTFFVPAGLGLITKAQFDNFGEAEIGFYDNMAGYYVTVELAAGEAYTFYVGALTKDTWTIDVYYYVEKAEIPEEELVLGEDGNAPFANVNYTYVATANGKLTLTCSVDAGTYTFAYSVNGSDSVSFADLAEIELSVGDELVIYVTVEGDDAFALLFAEWEEATSHVCNFNEVVSYTYENGYLNAGYAVGKCECGKTDEAEVAPLFTFSGYSIKDDGTAMCVGYTVNRELLAIYEEINNTTIKFGVVNAGYNNLVNADGKPVNADGTAAEVSKGKVAIKAVEDTVFTTFEIKMVSSNWSAIADVDIILCAYIIEGDEVSYICSKTETTDSAVAVTYNQVLLGGNE